MTRRRQRLEAARAHARSLLGRADAAQPAWERPPAPDTELPVWATEPEVTAAAPPRQPESWGIEPSFASARAAEAELAGHPPGAWADTAQPIDITDASVATPVLPPPPRRRLARTARVALPLAVLAAGGVAVTAFGLLDHTAPAPPQVATNPPSQPTKPRAKPARRHHRKAHPARRHRKARHHVALAPRPIVAAAPVRAAPAPVRSAPQRVVATPAPTQVSKPAPKPAPKPVAAKPAPAPSQPAASKPSGEPGRQPPPQP